MFWFFISATYTALALALGLNAYAEEETPVRSLIVGLLWPVSALLYVLIFVLLLPDLIGEVLDDLAHQAKDKKGS